LFVSNRGFIVISFSLFLSNIYDMKIMDTMKWKRITQYDN